LSRFIDFSLIQFVIVETIVVIVARITQAVIAREGGRSSIPEAVII
jgi:hypothetical protein